MVDQGRQGRVAVIEDDATARTALGRLLQVGGFEPALFENAETFIASAPNRGWLCLIVDVQLNGMSGIDLQRKLRSEGSDVPIIIISYKDREEDRLRGLELGANHYLTKSSFHDHTFLEAVAGLIGTGVGGACGSRS